MSGCVELLGLDDAELERLGQGVEFAGPRCSASGADHVLRQFAVVLGALPQSETRWAYIKQRLGSSS